jgi:hypothetical protein
MSRVGPTRKRFCRDAGRVLILSLGVLGLLFARSVPPSVPHSPLHSNVISQADHGHKQYFEHEYSQWADRPDTPLAMPLLAVSSHPAAAADLFVETVTHGLHYNRPPPLA